MRKTLLASLLLSPLLLFSQIKGDAKIEWLPKGKMFHGENTIEIPSFSGKGFTYDSAKRTITLIFDVPQSNVFLGNILEISNIEYESINKDELGDLDLSNIPKKVETSLKINEARGLKQGFIFMSPIIRDDFGYKRVQSFSYSISGSNSSRIAQSRNNDAI